MFINPKTVNLSFDHSLYGILTLSFPHAGLPDSLEVRFNVVDATFLLPQQRHLYRKLQRSCGGSYITAKGIVSVPPFVLSDRQIALSL